MKAFFSYPALIDEYAVGSQLNDADLPIQFEGNEQ